MKLLIHLYLNEEVSCKTFLSSTLCEGLKRLGFKTLEKKVCQGNLVVLLVDESIRPLMMLTKVLEKHKKIIERVDCFVVESYESQC